MTSTYVCAQERRVETNDGTAVEGEVVEERSDSLFLRTGSGEIRSIDVQDIIYLGPIEKTGPKRRSYPAVGGSFGTPSLMNIVVGYYFTGLSTRLSGMYLLGNFGGVQLDAGYPLSRTANVSIDLFGAIGYAKLFEIDDNLERRYLGLGAYFRYSMTFLSIGGRLDIGDVGGVSPMIQGGFIWEMTQ